jgi:hypothetical protein
MKNRPGRPRLDENDESVGVHVQMTAKQYDDVYSRAQRDRVTVPERIRRDVREGSEKSRRS